LNNYYEMLSFPNCNNNDAPYCHESRGYMPKKTKYDWPTIRREYSTAQFSDSELARRHGCSRGALQKQKKKNNWQKDNSTEVRHLAQAKLISEDASIAGMVAGKGAGCYTKDGEKEQAEIELAAETRVAVLRGHRKDISQLQELEVQLLAELLDTPKKLYMCNFQGDIFSEEVEIAVTERCQAINNLSSAVHKRVQLERQAFSLDDKDRDSTDGLPMVIVHDPGAVEDYNDR